MYTRSIRSSGWRIDLQERKNCKSQGVCYGGGGGDIVTSKIEPCIIEEEKYFNGIAVALKISAFKFPWDDLSQLLFKSHTSHRDQTPVKREIQIQQHRPGASKSWAYFVLVGPEKNVLGISTNRITKNKCQKKKENWMRLYWLSITITAKPSFLIK